MALLASLAAVACRSRREEGRGAVIAVVVGQTINTEEALSRHLWAAGAADGEDNDAAAVMGLEIAGLEERKKAKVVEGAKRNSAAAVVAAVRIASPAASIDVRRLLLPIFRLCACVVA